MPSRNPLLPFACAPLLLTLTRSVVPVSRSRTKISGTPFVSPGTRLSENETKATKRPLALTAPPRVPRSRMPPAAVQLKARQKSFLSRAWPTTTAPFAEASSPKLSVPLVTPRSCRPVADVQRKACRKPLEVVDQPVITPPSGETPSAEVQQPSRLPWIGCTPPDCRQTELPTTTEPSEDMSSAS